jgi:hypothetical protein
MRSNSNRLLSVIKVAGEITGRKKLQKIIYILKNLGSDFDEKFSFHYYGPYSFDLQFEINDLVANQFLIEEKENFTYNYKCPDNFAITSLDNEVQKKKDLIDSLNKYTPQELELVASIFFLKEYGHNDMDYFRKKLKNLKPNLADQIEKAIEIYSDLEHKKSIA